MGILSWEDFGEKFRCLEFSLWNKFLFGVQIFCDLLVAESFCIAHWKVRENVNMHIFSISLLKKLAFPFRNFCKQLRVYIILFSCTSKIQKISGPEDTGSENEARPGPAVFTLRVGPARPGPARRCQSWGPARRSFQIFRPGPGRSGGKFKFSGPARPALKRNISSAKNWDFNLHFCAI